MKRPKAKIKNKYTGLVTVEPHKKKVAIIGGSSSRVLAPWDDYSWECWGLNEIEQERAERRFELHPIGVQNPSELIKLGNYTEPVYLLKLDDDNVPMGVRYPIEKVLAVSGARDYFTCTFAYQVALAISEGFEEIGLWGVNLAWGSPRERTVERTCLEWWLGLSEGKGIKVTTPSSDDLLSHHYRYGYDYFSEKTIVDNLMYHLGTQIAVRNYLFGKSMRKVQVDYKLDKEKEI